MDYDFGGYATKNDLLCADGRVIRRDAFKDNDGKRVPLVWGHKHDDPDAVLGHALLENRNDGVYAYCSFNNTEKAKTARELVKHGDITSFSIFANRLKQHGENVVHGIINEVSLVLSGANPGAKIVPAAIRHGVGADAWDEFLDDEGSLFNGLNIEIPEQQEVVKHSDEEEAIEKTDETEDEESLEHSDDKQEGSKGDMANKEEGSKERTVGDVLDTMNDEQRKVVEFLVGAAAMTDPNEIDGENQNGGKEMKHNAFEGEDNVLMHSNIDTDGLFETVFNEAKNNGGRFKDSFLRHAEEYGVALGAHADTFDDTIAHAAGSAGNADGKEPFAYGITNPSILFPDAQFVRPEVDVINYEQSWVNAVMSGIGKTPFSRVRTHDADIRIEEARARGYVRSNEKANAFYTVAKRETTPTTVYVKTKFNRDDIVDITSFDVVNFTRTQVMRPKLNEEIARAILFGDGRDASSADKINEQNIRPILTDDEHYTVRTVLTNGLNDIYGMIEEIGAAADQFKGKGVTTLFTTFAIHNKMKWAKDRQNRRIYGNGEDGGLLGDLNVNKIEEVDTFMDNLTYDLDGETYRVVGLKVSLGDYNAGTDRGGDIFNAEDFDIDFNQYKYLMETRMSGALTRFHSAQVFLVPVEYVYTEATVTVGADVTPNTYYERSGSAGSYTYELTDDTTFQAGTTYYTRSIA